MEQQPSLLKIITAVDEDATFMADPGTQPQNNEGRKLNIRATGKGLRPSHPLRYGMLYLQSQPKPA